MSILLLAEHNNKNLQSSTLSTVTAAMQINDDVHILVAGHENDSVAIEAASIPGVKKNFTT